MKTKQEAIKECDDAIALARQELAEWQMFLEEAKGRLEKLKLEIK